jgi:hypothetical protein
MAEFMHKGIKIVVTRYEDVFGFGLGPSWSYEIDGVDRPNWGSSVSEQDAIRKAADIIDCFDYDLLDYGTADYIRKATIREYYESIAAGPTGVISVDGRSCYVM